MNSLIYADNAATTQLDKAALEAMMPWLLNEYGNASQPYSFARKPKKALEDARSIIAECIGALPEEIYFTSGGTESDNWAIKGAAFANPNNGLIISSAFEHHAVLRSCRAIEQLGKPVCYLTPTHEGVVSVEALNKIMSNGAQLVSIMYANNEIGTIQPIKELCKAAHRHRALFHTDAVQAVGHIEIDVKELGVDMLSASAHKFNGPKGIGFLYIRKGAKLAPYADGGAQERSLRAGTENIASIAAMASALKTNCEAIRKNQAHILAIEKELLNRLQYFKLPFKRNGKGRTLPGLISLSFAGFEAEMILHRMDLMGICVSAGSACNGQSTSISHVLKAIGLDKSLAKGTIRISLGKNNSLDDANKIASALAKIICPTAA